MSDRGTGDFGLVSPILFATEPATAPTGPQLARRQPAPSLAAASPGWRPRQEAALECPDQALEFAHTLVQGGVLGVNPDERGGGHLGARLPHRAMRHRGEQTRCGRRPVGGRPQTAHRPGSGGVRT
jgi:hypothetical protein